MADDGCKSMLQFRGNGTVIATSKMIRLLGSLGLHVIHWLLGDMEILKTSSETQEDVMAFEKRMGWEAALQQFGNKRSAGLSFFGAPGGPDFLVEVQKCCVLCLLYIYMV